MKNYYKNRQEKGITLIALVVTIIVLLILAGIAISMLAGNNSILNRATEAKEENIKGQVKEEIMIAWMGVQAEGIPQNMTLKQKKEKLLAELHNADTNTTIENLGDDTTPIKIKNYKGYDVELDADSGKITKVGEANNPDSGEGEETTPVTPTTYTITTTVTNGTYTGATSIVENGTATITITADTNYELPSTITVTGATYDYVESTGVITLSNTTGNVTISAMCTAVQISVRSLITETPTGANGKFSEGQEVTLGTIGDVAQKFFVLSDDGKKVELLAKYCLTQEGTSQTGKDAVSIRGNINYGRTFSSTNYWKDDFTSDPFDLQGEYLETHPLATTETVANNALKATKAYAEVISTSIDKTIKARLMSYTEAVAIIKHGSDTMKKIFWGKWTDDTKPDQGCLYWWLGDAKSTTYVWMVHDGYLNTNGSYNYRYLGVRPILEIE